MLDALKPYDEHNQRLEAHVHPPDWQNPSAEEKYHLVILGAGTAGLVTAIVAAGLGAKVALIEKHLMGGDCLNVGCVPSKGIISAARAWDSRRGAALWRTEARRSGRLWQSHGTHASLTGQHQPDRWCPEIHRPGSGRLPRRGALCLQGSGRSRRLDSAFQKGSDLHGRARLGSPDPRSQRHALSHQRVGVLAHGTARAFRDHRRRPHWL